MKKQDNGFGQWNNVKDKLPEYEKIVLVQTDDGRMMCAQLSRISRHIGPDTPFDDRWFAFPGWGHELRCVKEWCELPEVSK